MALKTTVRVGGLSGSTLVNYTSQVPLWELSGQGEHQSVFDAGMQCNNGSACQYQFVVDDDAGEIPKADLTKNLASHNQVTVSEDGPGYDAWLSRGRIADKSVGRADVDYGNSRGFSVTVDDANTDTRGLALTTAWVRGSESGRARILALAAAFLNGSPRLTTVVSTHLVATGGEVTMPAKTYAAGMDLNEIIGDCATTEGKVWALVIHHLASVSHLCLLYIDEADHTTYASTLSITDTSPNLTTSFPPIWDQGAATVESGGDNPISGVVSKYGSADDSFVYRTQSGITDAYDYWVVPYNDSLSQTAGQATSRADAILSSRRTEHVTHQVTIQIPATKVDLLCAGMSITIRSAAAMGGQYLNTTQTRRIGQLKWQLIAPDVGAIDGFYLAHMQLDRPLQILAEKVGLPVGPKPASGTAAAVTSSGGNSGSTGHDSIPVVVGAGQPRLVFAWLTHDGITPLTVNYAPSVPGTGVAMTLLGSVIHPTPSTGTNTDNETIHVYTLVNPIASVPAGGEIKVTFSGTQNGACMGYWVVDSTATPTMSSATGTGVGSSITPTAGAADLVLDVAGWRIWSLSPVGELPSATGGQTVNWAINHAGGSGQPGSAWGGGNKAGSGARTWTWTTSTNWVAAAIIFANAAGTTQPVGADGSATVGTGDGTYVGPGHIHEHGKLSPAATHHHGTAQIQGYTSGFSNPMTTQGDIIKGGTAGAAERLAIGTAGQVLKVNTGATAPEWGAGTSTSGLDPYAAEYRFTSGTAVDFSAATASGLTVSDVSGYLKLLTYVAVGEYWEATVAYGTGDFDVATRIIWTGPTLETSAVTNTAIDFYVGDTARTNRLRWHLYGANENSASNWAGQPTNDAGSATSEVNYGFVPPVILRIRRVGTTVDFFVSQAPTEMVPVWYQMRGTTSSVNYTRIGFQVYGAAPEGKMLIGWVRNL